MKLWSVAAGAMDLIALVDGQLRSLLSESENCKSFFGTQLTMFGTEHFDTHF